VRGEQIFAADVEVWIVEGPRPQRVRVKPQIDAAEAS
jgi:hypothetical protein